MSAAPKLKVIKGGGVTLPPSPYIVPMLHPANLFHGGMHYRGVLKHDLNRAVGLAKGWWKPDWNDDGYILDPTVDQIRAFLNYAKKIGRAATDIETDGQHPLVCQVRTIGLYAGERGICIRWLVRDGTFTIVQPEGKKKAKKKLNWKPRYTPEEEEEIRRILNLFYNDPGVELELQNGQFDALCLKARLQILIPPRWFDLMVADHNLRPHYPHGLGFIGSILTDVCYYKSTEEGEAWSSVDDESLARYCVRDCKVTNLSSATQRLELDASRNGLDRKIYEHDFAKAIECMKWKETGVLIDRSTQQLFHDYYADKEQRALGAMRTVFDGIRRADIKAIELTELCELVGEEEFKPGSLIQLRKLLIGLGVPLTALTKTGLISTARDFLDQARMDLLKTGVDRNDPRIAFLDYLFAWREASKTRSTFLNPEVLPDGRVHATFNVHVVPTGRLSSSDPNFQNLPKEIRGMYVAMPGHRLVMGDVDSGELRIAGLLSQEPGIVQAFIDFDRGVGPKIHKLNCSRIFGMRIEDVDSDSPMYRAAKCFIYSCLYGSGPNTAYSTVRKEMPDMTFQDFMVCYAAFKRAYPTLFAWQKDLVRQGSRFHYLDSPILKRREYFFERVLGEDSPEAAKMLNFPEQSGLADVVDLAQFRVLREVVPKYERKLKKGEVCRQIIQVHDELVFEVPERMSEAFAKDFKRVGEQPPDKEHAHWKLPIEVKIKERWADIPKEVIAWDEKRRAA